MLITFLVPLKDNGGDAFGKAAYHRLMLTLTELFGGATRMPGEAVGAWTDSQTGRTFDDRLYQYQVRLPSIAEGALVQSAVAYIKRAFRQEAVAVSYMGQMEIL